MSKWDGCIYYIPEHMGLSTYVIHFLFVLNYDRQLCRHVKNAVKLQKLLSPTMLSILFYYWLSFTISVLIGQQNCDLFAIFSIMDKILDSFLLF